MKRISSLLSVAALALLLGACAAPGPTPGEMEIRSGVIEQITSVQLASNHAPGVGAVVGGVAGLGIGSLIGGGTGRDVAMVLGTIGGAVAGNAVQRRYDAPQPGQQVIVRSYHDVLVSDHAAGQSGAPRRPEGLHRRQRRRRARGAAALDGSGPFGNGVVA